MDVEGFKKDSGGYQVAEVGSITISVKNSGLWLEQYNDESPHRDLILFDDEEQVEGIIQKLQAWLDAQPKG